jgi:tetratricopeptide (TPR) repeat protein
LDENSELSYRVRGTAKELLKDRSGAMADMDRAIELAPLDASTYADRADVDTFWDDFSAANADLQHAFQINSNCSEAFETRAALVRKQGNIPAAVADYYKALKLSPQVGAPEIYNDLGRIENDSFQWNAALDYLSKGQAYYPARYNTRFYIF